MERKIGEIFELGGEWYQCLESTDRSCKYCDMNFDGKCPIPIHECTESGRSDKSYIIFKRLEKIGKPFLIRRDDNSIIKYQRYKIYTPFVIKDTNINYNNVENFLRIDIEIKQNKEDMEEKKENWREEDTPLTRLVGRYVNNLIDYTTLEKGVKELYSNEEERKPILKEFDLEAAKAGKPVCTRDGRKARIICFDAKRKDGKSIVTLVPSKDYPGFEDLITYPDNGNYYGGHENDGDLMMLSEKKSGYIHLKNNGVVFKDKETAVKKCPEGYIVVKVEWEE